MHTWRKVNCIRMGGHRKPDGKEVCSWGTSKTSLEEALTTTEMQKLMKCSRKDINKLEMSRDLEMPHDEKERNHRWVTYTVCKIFHDDNLWTCSINSKQSYCFKKGHWRRADTGAATSPKGATGPENRQSIGRELRAHPKQETDTPSPCSISLLCLLLAKLQWQLARNIF